MSNTSDNNYLYWLWGVVAFCSVSCIVLTIQVFYAFTKLRAVCLFSGLWTLVLSITNTLRSFNQMDSDTFTLLFAVVTIGYVDLVVVIFLSIGGNFLSNSKKQPQWSYRLVVVMTIVFSAALLVDIILRMTIGIKHTEDLILTAVVIVCGMCAMLGSVLYTFLPLLNIIRRELNVDAAIFAAGAWYFSIIVSINGLFLIFYIVMLGTGVVHKYYTQGIDFIFRTCLLLAYSLPPPQTVIHMIHKRLFNGRPSLSDKPSRTLQTV